MNTNVARPLAAIILASAWINPFVEKLDSQIASVFMFSHYALFLTGLLVGLWYFKWPNYLWIMGAFLVTFWHFPMTFALSAKLLAFRFPEEATIFLGGVLIGSNQPAISQRLKTGLLGVWVLADSILSAIFILDPKAFSGVAASPFSGAQFILTGVAMAIFMNIVLAYILYGYFRKLHIIQKELAKGYQ